MHKVNTKLPHVFLKHKNEKTHGKEQQERCGEKGWQLHGKAAQDGGRVETMVVGREGGFTSRTTRWWWTASFTDTFSHTPHFYSLSVPCSCCYAFLYRQTPPLQPLLQFCFCVFVAAWIGCGSLFVWRGDQLYCTAKLAISFVIAYKYLFLKTDQRGTLKSTVRRERRWSGIVVKRYFQGMKSKWTKKT